MTVVLTLVSVSFIFVVSGAAANFLKRKFIGYCKVGYCRIFFQKLNLFLKQKIVIGDMLFHACEGALYKPNTGQSTKLLLSVTIEILYKLELTFPKYIFAFP